MTPPNQAWDSGLPKSVTKESQRTPAMKATYAETVQMSLVRILVVDDFSHWQDFVRVCLEKRPDIHILGVATSGLEAIQKAEDLQPDLILLDIGLPEMNGIQAAEQIRQLVPKTKIIFLTGQSDPEIVRAAFRAGGDGYILKWDAAQELIVGMEAVLLGKRFTSRGIADI
jgi:two-component system nitrate/nitrite response regulator NarL